MTRPPIAALSALTLVTVGGMVFLAATDSAGPILGIAGSLARAGFWGLILLAAARVGAWIVGSRAVGLAHLAWDGAVGLTVLIAGWLAVGLAPGGFRPPTLLAVLAIFGALALIVARRDPVARFRHAFKATASATWAVAGIALVVVTGLAWNRVPVLFFDTLAYHYAQPELWLLNGRIAAESWSLHSWFPPGMSVLYGVGLGLGGERWANDANLLLGVVLALLAFDLARSLWGGPAGLIALAQLLVLPQIPYALAIPAADLGHGTFTAASLGALCLGRWRNDGTALWYRRAGWLAGGAVLTKYLGFVVPLALGAAWIFLAGLRRSPDHGVRFGVAGALRWVAPALVLVAPWLVANTISVGNPVAPMFDRVLEPRGLATGGAERFRSDALGGLPEVGDLVRLWPGLVAGSVAGSRLYPTPAWGWTLVALLPILLLAQFVDRDVRLLSSVAGGVFAVWFLTFRWERFLVATTFLLAVAAAGSVVAVWRRGGAARGLALAAAAVAALSLVHTGQEIAMFTGGLPVALGQESPRAFVQYSFPTTRFYREAAEKLDRATAHVLLVGDARHFRLPVRRAAPTGFNIHPLADALARRPDFQQANRELRALGFTHLLVDLGWVERSAKSYPSLALFRDQPELLLAYLASLGPPLHQRRLLALFEIPERLEREAVHAPPLGVVDQRRLTRKPGADIQFGKRGAGSRQLAAHRAQGATIEELDPLGGGGPRPFLDAGQFQQLAVGDGHHEEGLAVLEDNLDQTAGTTRVRQEDQHGALRLESDVAARGEGSRGGGDDGGHHLDRQWVDELGVALDQRSDLGFGRTGGAGARLVRGRAGASRRGSKHDHGDPQERQCRPAAPRG